MKKTIAVLLLIVLTLTLVGCGQSEEASTKVLVQGNIDSIYLGKATSEYLKMVDTTQEKVEADYIDGMNKEAEFFCTYFNIIDPEYGETYETLSDGIKNDIVEMYKEIYNKSSYTVGEPVKSGDGFDVLVTINPIDIIEKAFNKLEEGYEPYEEFAEKYQSIDLDAMSEDEILSTLDQYTSDYSTLLIDLINGLIPELGYKDAKEVTVHVEKNENDRYHINQDDWTVIDDYIIYYP